MIGLDGHDWEPQELALMTRVGTRGHSRCSTCGIYRMDELVTGKPWIFPNGLKMWDGKSTCREVCEAEDAELTRLQKEMDAALAEASRLEAERLVSGEKIPPVEERLRAAIAVAEARVDTKK